MWNKHQNDGTRFHTFHRSDATAMDATGRDCRDYYYSTLIT